MVFWIGLFIVIHFDQLFKRIPNSILFFLFIFTIIEKQNVEPIIFRFLYSILSFTFFLMLYIGGKFYCAFRNCGNQIAFGWGDLLLGAILSINSGTKFIFCFGISLGIFLVSTMIVQFREKHLELRNSISLTPVIAAGYFISKLIR